MIIKKFTNEIPGVDSLEEVFYTIERFHHAGGLAKPIARLAVIIPETKTKSFIFSPLRSSPPLNRGRLKKQLNKITNYQ